MNSTQLSKVNVNLKRAKGTLSKIIDSFDSESFDADEDLSHFVQQLDSVMGYLSSARKDVINFGINNCVECSKLDSILKDKLLKKIDDINKLKK